MKVIVKSNEYIAIPTDNKAKCLYLLGQYLNKETCKIEMRDDEVQKIVCTKKADDSKWNTTITLETEIPYKAKFIILDLEGNLVNVVTDEQFTNQYAVLKDEDENEE